MKIKKIKQLVNLASEELGFTSKHLAEPCDKSAIPLYLAEIQTLLREKHEVEVFCMPIYPSIAFPTWSLKTLVESKVGTGGINFISAVNRNIPDEECDDKDDFICTAKSYERAMTESLIFSIKMIIKDGR